MFKNVSIKFRLAATMAFMGIMLVAGGAMGVIGLKSTNSALQDVYSNQLASSAAINTSVIRLLQARTVLDRLAVRPDVPDAAESLKRTVNGF